MMSKFNELLDVLRDHMVKQDTRLKLSVLAEERFDVTLRTILKITAPNSNKGCAKQNM